MTVDLRKTVAIASTVILQDAFRAKQREAAERWRVGYSSMNAEQWFIGSNATMTAWRPASFPGRPQAGGDLADEGIKKALRLHEALPGVRLPSVGELAARARTAPLMTWLESLAAWVGRGRAVTGAHALSKADVIDAARWLGTTDVQAWLLWGYGLAGRWVEVAPSGNGQAVAVAGPTALSWARSDHAGILGIWSDVLVTVLASTLESAAELEPGGPGGADFRGLGALAAVRLFHARGDGGMPIDSVTEMIVRGAVGELAWSRSRKEADLLAPAGDPVRVLVDQLAALAAIERSPMAGKIRLAPLALRVLRAEMLALGVDVPLVSASAADMTAADLLALNKGVSSPEFEAEADAWTAARGPRQAARELLTLAYGGDAATRLTAVRIVRSLGEAAAPEWRACMKWPQLKPYARIALAAFSNGMSDSTMPLVLEPSPDDLTWLAIDLLALACGEDDPDPDLIADQFGEAVPEGAERRIFDLMSQGTHPDVVRVLTVLGDHHPDRRIAREARKAARQAARFRSAAEGVAGAAPQGKRQR